jgi:hypothetical protein
MLQPKPLTQPLNRKAPNTGNAKTGNAKPHRPANLAGFFICPNKNASSDSTHRIALHHDRNAVVSGFLPKP